MNCDKKNSSLIYFSFPNKLQRFRHKQESWKHSISHQNNNSSVISSDKLLSIIYFRYYRFCVNVLIAITYLLIFPSDSFPFLLSYCNWEMMKHSMSLLFVTLIYASFYHIYTVAGFSCVAYYEWVSVRVHVCLCFRLSFINS